MVLIHWYSSCRLNEMSRVRIAVEGNHTKKEITTWITTTILI